MAYPRRVSRSEREGAYRWAPPDYDASGRGAMPQDVGYGRNPAAGG